MHTDGGEPWTWIRPFSEEERTEYDRFVDLVNDAFAVHGKEDEDFEVHVEGGAVCEAQLFIKNYQAFPADRVRDLARQLRDELVRFRHYWKLTVYVYRPDLPYGEDDTALWLTIDRYSIDQYPGQIESSKFADMEEFTSHYWRG
jgi:hypothetical protein